MLKLSPIRGEQRRFTEGSSINYVCIKPRFIVRIKCSKQAKLRVGVEIGQPFPWQVFRRSFLLN